MTPTVLSVLHFDGSFPTHSAARSSMQEPILLPQIHLPNSSSWYDAAFLFHSHFIPVSPDNFLSYCNLLSGSLPPSIPPTSWTPHPYTVDWIPLAFSWCSPIHSSFPTYFTMPSTDLKKHSRQGNLLQPYLPKIKRRQQKMRKRTSNLQR